LEKFGDFVEAQGGDKEIITNENILPQANHKIDVFAEEEGYIEKIHADNIGRAAMILGAGRQKKEDNIDLSAGILLHKKIGDIVAKDDVIAEIHWNNHNVIEEAQDMIQDAYRMRKEKQKKTKLIKALVTIENEKIY